MKHSLRSTLFTIPDKLRVEIRASISDAYPASRHNVYEGGKSSQFNLLGALTVQIVRPRTDDGGGQSWNPNDTIMLTKYYIPIFYRELKAIYDGMHTPNLYTYTDNRLELDPKLGESIRRVFTVSQKTMVELSPVVITTMVGAEEQHVEGVKMKFNNEDSTVLLTINDLYALMWTIDHVDVESIVMGMYEIFVKTGESSTKQPELPEPKVDIVPLQRPPELI